MCQLSFFLQVSRRLGNMLYMMNLPLSTASLQATPEKPGDHSPEIGSPVNCNSEDMMASPRDPDVLKSTEHLHETENNSPPSASSEMAWSALIMWTDANLSRPSLHLWHYLSSRCHSAGFVYIMINWIEDAFLLCATWAFNARIHTIGSGFC